MGAGWTARARITGCEQVRFLNGGACRDVKDRRPSQRGMNVERDHEKVAHACTCVGISVLKILRGDHRC